MNMTLAANAWMDYVERAVSSLYPTLRPGYDYTWGRRPLPADSPPETQYADPEMLHWSDKLIAADMGAIQAKAQEYAETDPQARQEPGTEPGNGGGTAPAAPTVTPIAVAAPVPVGTAVADITGPGAYAVVTGAGSVTLSGAQLQAAVELTADTEVGVTASNAAGTSSETLATITVTPATRSSRSRKNDDE
jgi:hypothetical protein